MCGAEAGETILSSLILHLECERLWILKSLEASCGAMSRIILQPISKLRWLHGGGVPYWVLKDSNRRGKWEDVQKREEEKD